MMLSFAKFDCFCANLKHAVASSAVAEIMLLMHFNPHSEGPGCSFLRTSQSSSGPLVDGATGDAGGLAPVHVTGAWHNPLFMQLGQLLGIQVLVCELLGLEEDVNVQNVLESSHIAIFAPVILLSLRDICASLSVSLVTAFGIVPLIEFSLKSRSLSAVISPTLSGIVPLTPALLMSSLFRYESLPWQLTPPLVTQSCHSLQSCRRVPCGAGICRGDQPELS